MELLSSEKLIEKYVNVGWDNYHLLAIASGEIIWCILLHIHIKMFIEGWCRCFLIVN